MKEKQERFGFRKLTIGLASVCIGATLFGTNLNTVKADTIDSSSQAAKTNEAKTTDSVDTNDVTTSSNSANQIQSDKQNEATTLGDLNKTDVSVNNAHKAMPDASSKTGEVNKQDEASATNTLTSSSNNTHVATTVANSTPVKHDNKLTATVNTNFLAKPAATTPTSNITNKALTASKVATKDPISGSNEDDNAIATANPRLLANLNKILVAKQPALISKKIANANLKLIDNTLPVLNTNDAYALDEKNGLHEHANVNDNGGYDKDFWGAIDLNNWNYAQDDTGNITLEGYKGGDNTKIIIPNIADFAQGNAIKTITLQVNPNVDTDKVYISSSVMHDLAHNATRIGLSKTENKKVAASDAIWQDAFGGLTNGPSGDNSDGGINVLNPNLTVMDLHNLDTSNITNMSAMFNCGTNLKTIGDLSDWDTGHVTDMSAMFQSASNLTNIGNLNDWNTSNVTDMGYMFNRASNLTNIGDLSKWDTSKVTDMSAMFQLVSNLTNIGNLDNWNTSNVTDMSYMFSRASNLTNIGDLSKWDTSNVTDMGYMFNKALNLANIGDLSKWDTSKVTNMKAMFQLVSSLTNIGNLNNWNTSNVTDMSYMFNQASNLTNIGNLNNWNTSKVTDMNHMFNEASSLTNIGNLSGWDTSKVTNMSTMFQLASSLTNIGNLDNWKTGNVTDMSWMFNKALNLTNIGNLSKWDTSNVTDMQAMFQLASSLTNIGDLNNWNTSNVTDMNRMFAKTSNLTNIGNLSKWDTSKVTNMEAMFGEASNLTNIGDLNDWNTGNVTNMRWMFNQASNLTNIGDLSKWDTSNVTDMSWMFNQASNLTNIGDLSKWDTSKVTDMKAMFELASSLTNIGNLDNWNTSNVTDMGWMFTKASNLTNIGDLSNWDTSNVKNMNAMFNSVSNLTNIGDLSKWNTSKVTDMKAMFELASSLTNIGNLDNWNTGNVTDMSWMFNLASNLTNIGNLSKWNTGNVTDMRYMFNNTSKLANIGDLSGWDTSNVTDMSWMFVGTKSLHNLNISNWNLAKLTNKEALKYIFANDVNLTVIANNITLPAWYDNELNNSDYFWNNHIAVITNNDKLLKATGDTDTLTIDNTHAARSIFYDSKGSSDAIKVLTDVNDQYIADYNKANPSKLLKLADTVNKNDPISLANASFITVPKVFNITVHFEDVDPHADQDNDAVKQELVKTVELSGSKDNAVDLSQVQLPTNFELSGDLPSATFGDTDSVTIKLQHKIDKNHITNKHNNTVTLGTDVQAPDGTLLLKGQSTIESIIDQYRDLVTGDNVDGPTHWSFTAQDYTHGSDDIINKYIENYELSNINVDSTDSWNDAVSKALDRGHNNGFLTIKLKDGYTASMNDIGSDWTYSSNTNTYTWLPNYYNAYQTGGSYVLFKIVSLDQSIHYQFMDNGTQVGSDVIVTGKTGETVVPNLKVPDNYEVADGTTLPTSYTFDATNPTVQINLKHKTETSVESLPATRTINVHLPNGTTKVYQQVIGYQRDVITDLVTKKVTNGTWTVNDVTSSFTIDGVKQLEHSYVLENGTYNYASVKLPKIPGYKAKISRIPSGNLAQAAMFLVSFVALPSVNPGVQNTQDDTKQDQDAVIDTKKDQDVVIDTKQNQDAVIDTKQDQDAVIDMKHVNTSNMQMVSNQPVLLENADDNSQTLNADTNTSTWQVENSVTDELIAPYVVFNSNYKLHLPRFNNYNLQIIKRTSNKDNLSFVYLNQNKTFKYVFNIKIEDGKYLLSISQIENKRFIPVKQISFNDYQQLIKLIVKLIK